MEAGGKSLYFNMSMTCGLCRFWVTNLLSPVEKSLFIFSSRIFGRTEQDLQKSVLVAIKDLKRIKTKLKILRKKQEAFDFVIKVIL